MPNAKKELPVGSVFNRLMCISKGFRKGKNWYYQFECSCGTVKDIQGSDVWSEKTISCGCHRDEMTSKRSRIHGDSGTYLHNCWSGFIRRYGDDFYWQDYGVFRLWAYGSGYSEGKKLKAEVDGIFTPDACYWR